MQKATGRDTPAAQEPLGSDKDGEPFNEEWSYPAAVGMLLYLSSNTRPDIQFAVHTVLPDLVTLPRNLMGRLSNASSAISLKPEERALSSLLIWNKV